MPQYARTTATTQTIVGVQTLLSLPLTITGKRVRVLGHVNLQLVAGHATIVLRLIRAGVAVAVNPDCLVASDTGAMIDVVDKPGPGTHTYALVVEKTAGTGTLTAACSSLSVEELPVMSP